MRYLLILSVLFLCSCTATYQRIPVNDKVPDIKLSNDSGVLISIPKDGVYGNTIYEGSGKMTARATRAAFGRHVNNVQISRTCNDLLTCIQIANEGGFAYYVKPQIFHWEERATEWSGKPDRIEIKISIFDAENGNEIHSSILKGKSKWATFGGDHPQDLLPEPLEDYVSSLY